MWKFTLMCMAFLSLSFWQWSQKIDLHHRIEALQKQHDSLLIENKSKDSVLQQLVIPYYIGGNGRQTVTVDTGQWNQHFDFNWFRHLWSPGDDDSWVIPPAKVHRNVKTDTILHVDSTFYWTPDGSGLDSMVKRHAYVLKWIEKKLGTKPTAKILPKKTTSFLGSPWWYFENERMIPENEQMLHYYRYDYDTASVFYYDDDPNPEWPSTNYWKTSRDIMKKVQLWDSARKAKKLADSLYALCDTGEGEWHDSTWLSMNKLTALGRRWDSLRLALDSSTAAERKKAQRMLDTVSYMLQGKDTLIFRRDQDPWPWDDLHMVHPKARWDSLMRVNKRDMSEFIFIPYQFKK